MSVKNNGCVNDTTLSVDDRYCCLGTFGSERRPAVSPPNTKRDRPMLNEESTTSVH